MQLCETDLEDCDADDSDEDKDDNDDDDNEDEHDFELVLEDDKVDNDDEDEDEVLKRQLSVCSCVKQISIFSALSHALTT